MNKIHPVNSVLDAEALLTRLGIEWEIVATTKQNVGRDPVVNQYKDSYGNACHFVNAKSRAIASFVQETKALVIYERPKPIALITYIQLNCRRKDGRKFSSDQMVSNLAHRVNRADQSGVPREDSPVL